MHLQTVYAPPTFLKPCVAIDTVFSEGGTKETTAITVEALNTEHTQRLLPTLPWKDWHVIKKHITQEDAIAFHLCYARHFNNGGSQEEWEAGYGTYLQLLALIETSPTVAQERAGGG